MSPWCHPKGDTLVPTVLFCVRHIERRPWGDRGGGEGPESLQHTFQSHINLLSLKLFELSWFTNLQSLSASLSLAVSLNVSGAKEIVYLGN